MRVQMASQSLLEKAISFSDIAGRGYFPGSERQEKRELLYDVP